MVCKEYFPNSTHSDLPDCKNCRYNGGYTGCRNVNYNVALGRVIEKDKLNNFNP